jgi:hypothetical protein
MDDVQQELRVCSRVGMTAHRLQLKAYNGKTNKIQKINKEIEADSNRNVQK